MSEFSEKLNYYIKEKEIKIYTLAKLSGLDRPGFYKFLRGERLPKMETVEKFVSYLQLTIDERQDLMNAWEITNVGPETYYRRKFIMKFLSEFPNYGMYQNRYIHISSAVQQDSNQVSVISGRASLDNFMMSMLSEECEKEHGSIRVLMPIDAEVTRIFASVESFVKNLTVTHIIPFEHNEGHRGDTDFYNLSTIRSILPLYTYTYQYSAYYFYGNTGAEPLLDQMYSNMVVISDCALLLNRKRTEGIVIREAKTARYLKEKFDTFLKHCSKIARGISKPIELIEYVQKTVSATTTSTYSFQMIPCVTPFLTPDIFAKYVKPEYLNNQEFIRALSGHVNFLGEAYNGSLLKEIFSEAGLKYFLEHGRLSEYPPELYSPFATEDCVKIVHRILESNGAMYHYRMLKENIGDVIYGANLYISDSCGYILFLNPLNQKMVYMDLLEYSILKAFRDFLQHLPDSMFYTDEEMHQKVEEILKEYES